MFETEHDQAAGLRRLLRRPPLRLLPVVGAVGGDALGAVAAGLAEAFAAAGHRTLLVDGVGGNDRPAATVESPDVPRVAVPDRIDGRGAAWLRDLVFSHPGRELALLAAPEATLGALLEPLDPEVLVLCGPAREDITHAYALIKRLSRGYGLARFRTLFVGASDQDAARRRHCTLAAVAARHLALEIGLAGVTPGSSAGGRDCGDATRSQGAAASAGLAAVVAASRHWRLAVVGGGDGVTH